MRKSLVALAGCTLFATAPAHAVVVFSDNFNGENAANGGVTQFNYGSATGSFANFTVTGNVDLVRSGDFGVNCADGGLCVDLNGTGSSQNGVLTSRGIFSFSAGDTVTLLFNLSGNQRSGADPDGDAVTAGFNAVGGNLSVSRYGFNYGTSGVTFGPANFSGFGFSPSVAATDPYRLRTVFFTATQAGTVRFYIGAVDQDDFGPILDSVSLDISPAVGAIPEPATWAMLIGGFGMIGGTMRRRATLRVSENAAAQEQRA